MTNYRLEWKIAVRYLHSGSHLNLFNFSTRISFLFMSLTIFVMLLVLCIFSGFQRTLDDTLKTAGDHIVIRNYANNQSIRNYPKLLQFLSEDEELQKKMLYAIPSIAVNGLTVLENSFEAKLIKALPLAKGDSINEKFKYFPNIVHYNEDLLKRFEKGNYILIGRQMARQMHWKLGDKVKIYLPEGLNFRKGTDISMVDVRIAGFFKTGFYEFDLNLMYLSLPTAQRLLKLRNQATNILVQLNTLDRISYTAGRIEFVLNELNEKKKSTQLYETKTIYQQYGHFIASLKLEKVMMTLITSLLILAGIAGIWTTLHLLVKSKIRSIGMLRAMGLPHRSIVIIFTLHAMLIGLFSCLIGGSLGIYVAARLGTFITLIETVLYDACSLFVSTCNPVVIIPKEIYYFTELPVYADISIAFGVTLFTLILSALSGYIPATNAGKINIVTTIRDYS